jgi:hypothetical protein
MKKLRENLDNIAISLIYSLIIVLINLVIIFIFTQDIIQILYWLSFITLIEGGLGLIAGAGSVFYSPIFNKAFEKIFHTEPWDYKKQKRTEQQALKWIITGFLLIAEALIISAI